MTILEQDIAVNYYAVKTGSNLHKAIEAYYEECENFIERTKNLIAKYDADSAIRMYDYFNMSVAALNFDDEHAPFSWEMNELGSFTPYKDTKASEDFNVSLPYFRSFYKDAPDNIRFGTLGDQIIASIPQTENGAITQITDADPISEEEFSALKDAASKEQQEYIAQLSQREWTAEPLFRTSVFKPSEEVQKLKTERFNIDKDWKLAVKHSHTGRLVRRAIQKLGL